jgi:hypothetical protein
LSALESRAGLGHARGEAESAEGRRDNVEALRWDRSGGHCPDHVVVSVDGEVENPEADGRSRSAFDMGAFVGPHGHA